MSSSRDGAAVDVSGPVADLEPQAATQNRSVLVEDGMAAGPHQLTRTAFLERLDEVVRASVEGVLRPAGWSVRDCPYLGRYLERLRDEPLAELEAVVGLWVGPAHDTVDDWLDAVARRAGEAAVAWRDGRSDPLLRRVVPSADDDLVGSARRADPRAVMTRLGEGEPLPAPVRSRAEHAFGVDFSRVRVHVDAVAQRVATETRSRAFTLGDHIGFAAGEFRPGTVVGDAVLGHELAHTMQQAGSIAPGHDTAGLEHEADRMALAAGRGAGPQVAGGRGLALQRCGVDQDAVPTDASVPPAAGVEGQGQDLDLRSGPVTGTTGAGPLTTPVQQGGSTPAVVAPTVPTKPTSGGSVTADFTRAAAPGAVTEPPSAAAMPAPLPVEPVPTDPLAVTDDPLPLDSVKDAEPFWGQKDAESVATEIAAAYVARKAKKPRDVAALQADFDDVLRASFTRSGWGVPWQSLRPVLQKRVAQARASFVKAHPKATPVEVAAAVHQTKQEQRERVRQWVATATWAWMVERRDRLDFETIGAPGGREVAKLPADARLDDAAKDRVRRGAVGAVSTYLVGLQAELEKQRAAVAGSGADAQGPEAGKPVPKKKPTPLDRSVEAVAAVLGSTRAMEALFAKRDELQQRLDAPPSTPLGEVPLAVDDPKAKANRQKLISQVAAADDDIRKALPKLLADVDALRTTHKLRGIGAVRVGDLVFNPTGAFTWSGVDTPIHHRLAEILDAIGADYGTFGAGSYGGVGGGHASGDFTSSFRSVDLYPASAPAAGGYFDRDKALAFALAIDRVAAVQGYTYRILYDDYVVAREFNKQAKFGRMSNQDNVEFDKDAKGQPQLDKPRNLNWHGPIVTHFHVDFSY